MPVAYEVAKALRAPLDVIVVRKLGVPGWEELAMGAIASGGVRVINEEVVRGRTSHPSGSSGRRPRNWKNCIAGSWPTAVTPAPRTSPARSFC